jgi:hypothetical protein
MIFNIKMSTVSAELSPKSLRVLLSKILNSIKAVLLSRSLAMLIGVCQGMRTFLRKIPTLSAKLISLYSSKINQIKCANDCIPVSLLDRIHTLFEVRRDYRNTITID